jgi:general secretion pathway protein I
MGFTLLEAIVALTIIGLALVPFATFISLSTNTLVKAAEANDRSFVMEAAIAFMDSVNPVEEPSGTIELYDEFEMSWNSEELVPPQRYPFPNIGLPTHRLGFYNVHVELFRESTGPWFAFHMRKVGYIAPQESDLMGGPGSGIK